MDRNLLGIALVGGAIYGWEVPNWFRWIDRWAPGGSGRAALTRTALALVYFNPLWIARHLAFIALFSGDWQALGWGLIRTGTWSFIGISPLALLANWLIQNRLALRHRFVASALFSTLLAVYYAVTQRLF